MSKTNSGYSRSPYAWTGEEDNIIRGASENKLTDKEIQPLLPNRTVGSIHTRRHQLGIIKLRHFSEEEILKLKAMFEDHFPVEDIAAELDRSLGVVKQKIFHLGLRRNHLKTRLVKEHGPHVLNLAQDPHEVFAILKKQAMEARKQSKAEFEAKVAQALAEMMCDLSSGIDRRMAFSKARLAGATLEQIGRAVGLTRERVRQIVFGITNTRGPARLEFAKSPPRQLVCKNCGNDFTINRRGRFLYCDNCQPVIQERNREKQRLDSREYARTHKEKVNAYKDRLLKERREATLFNKLERLKNEDPAALTAILETLLKSGHSQAE